MSHATRVCWPILAGGKPEKATGEKPLAVWAALQMAPESRMDIEKTMRYVNRGEINNH